MEIEADLITDIFSTIIPRKTEIPVTRSKLSITMRENKARIAGNDDDKPYPHVSTLCVNTVCQHAASTGWSFLLAWHPSPGLSSYSCAEL